MSAPVETRNSDLDHTEISIATKLGLSLYYSTPFNPSWSVRNIGTKIVYFKTKNIEK
jgi:hypothetical protein